MKKSIYSKNFFQTAIFIVLVYAILNYNGFDLGFIDRLVSEGHKYAENRVSIRGRGFGLGLLVVIPTLLFNLYCRKLSEEINQNIYKKLVLVNIILVIVFLLGVVIKLFF